MIDNDELLLPLFSPVAHIKYCNEQHSNDETFKPLDEICKKKSSWGKLMQAVNRGDSNMVKLLLTDVNHKQAFELWIDENRQQYADFFLDENLPLYRAAYNGY